MRIPWSIIWRTSCLASGSRQTAQPLSRFLVGACEQSSARPDGSAPFQSLYQLARRASSNGQAGSVKSQRCGVFSRRSPLDSWRSQTFSHSFSTTKTLDRSSAKLPNDYDPDKGLPFRKKDLTKEEVAAVFGPTIDPALANEVLRVQHGRRLAGILEATSVELPSSSSYSPDFPEQALAWLRKNVPVDEEAILAAMVREEEQRREKVLADRAEQLGLYKPQEDIQINGPGRQSKSGLDLIREQNEARLDALERERDEKLKKQAQVNPAGTKQLSWRYADLTSSSGLQTNPEWVEAQRKGAVTTSKAAPDMSKMQRLLPSLLVTLLAVGASIIFANSYVPPSKSSRLFPDLPPAAATILTIIGINLVVYLTWKKSSLWGFMNRYFMQVPAYPFAITSLTNLFSHQTLGHFAINMSVLWIIGTKLHDEVGRGNFLAIFLASGAVGSMVSLTRVVLMSSWLECSLGASGGVCGVVAAWCWLNSDKKFSFVFLPENWLPPLDSTTFLALLIGYELVARRLKLGFRNVDIWAHMGGYAAGIAGAQMLKNKIHTQRAVEDRRRRSKSRNWMEKVKDGTW